MWKLKKIIKIKTPDGKKIHQVVYDDQENKPDNPSKRYEEWSDLINEQLGKSKGKPRSYDERNQE